MFKWIVIILLFRTFSSILSDSNFVITSKSLIILVILSTPFAALFRNLVLISLSSNPPSNRVNIYP